MPQRPPKTPSTPGPSHNGGHSHGPATPMPEEPPAVSAGASTQPGSSRKKTAQHRGSLPGTPSAAPATPTTGGRTSSSVNLLRQAALAAAQGAGDAASQGRDGSQLAAGQKRRAASHESDDAGSEPVTPSTPHADVEMSDGEARPPGGGVAGEGDAVVSMEVVTEQDGEGEDVGPQDVLAASDGTSLDPNARKNAPISKEAEIEKLRTSGSMTQSSHEVSRVKNLNKIQMGAHEIETWYFSPYPVEYAYVDMLYICEMCLSYFPSDFMLRRHRQKCGLVHPPGNEIYRHEDISFFEIDGRRQKTWCRNLCLISKCFLDHKTLYYDVDPFLYYVMAQRDDAGVHIIGYFSKEKESAENYNVACILTLPQHQRSGFGRLLIEFSYELTKREHKLGSPEKPLSDLGLLGYRAYWAETIVELLLRTEEDISIEEISNRTAIIPSDVLHTCTALNMLKHYQGKHYLVLNDTVLQQHEKQMKKKRRRIVPEKLYWEPPKFTREQLRFGW
ncbi:histone acetyltransferase [Ceraceosorus bombacis]|uniref:histone acetyltransferase n=1 Tax=Ceraceosorus bombacis TaxID=401625 RepID=A0A0P1BH60_9BASI|nr:histone acetyltransferase [Ceraceosorus bombacis]